MKCDGISCIKEGEGWRAAGKECCSTSHNIEARWFPQEINYVTVVELCSCVVL